MNLTIDTHTLTGTATGIPRYVGNLIKAIEQINDPSLDLRKVGGNITGDLKTPNRLYWEAVTLPRIIKQSNADIFHVPGFGVKKLKHSKVIITAHDIIGYLFPQNLSFSSRYYWSKWLPKCFKKADHLITVSENSRKDLIEHLGIAPEKISVTYIAPDNNIVKKPTDIAKQILEKELGLTDPFVLCVGTIEPRKNLVRLLEAFNLVKKRRKDIPKLLVVGAKQWGSSEFEKAVKQNGLEEDVITTGFVSDEILSCAYSAAEMVAFVSLYEGFGLPLIEAFHCGTPVLCSNNSSLGELGKDSAELVNPYDIEEISIGIENILVDDQLRKELVHKGQMKAAEFSWEKTAKETLEIYKNVLAQE